MPNPIRTDLEDLVNDSIAFLPEGGDHVELAVGFFDLVGSTQRKLTKGHLFGTLAAMQHNTVCEKVGAKFKGDVVKSLGDGVLMSFPSSREAALAALNIVEGLTTHAEDLHTKVGLTVGSVERVTVQGRPDLLGAVVDRCARLQAIAQEDEIVVDRPFVDSVRSHLMDFQGVELAGPQKELLKGIGQRSVWRLEML
jgi:adenylate cyclase